jgi:hypothetical protein
MCVIFLPPYSPDYNPIEEAFSTIKAQIQQDDDMFLEQMGEKDNADVYLHLHDVVFSITKEDAAGFFCHSRYF